MVKSFLLTCLLLLLAVPALSAAEAPQVVLVGGPNLLWPQVIREYERRYPSQPATCVIDANRDATHDADQPDLMFAYYPTQEQLKPTLTLSAKHWLGFPTEFVGATWKRSVEQDASAKAAAYILTKAAWKTASACSRISFRWCTRVP